MLILFVILGIVYIWLNEQNRQQELEATTYKIRSLRKDVHGVYMKVVDLSMISSIRVNDQYRIEFEERAREGETIATICNIIDLSNHYK